MTCSVTWKTHVPRLDCGKYLNSNKFSFQQLIGLLAVLCEEVCF